MAKPPSNPSVAGRTVALSDKINGPYNQPLIDELTGRGFKVIEVLDGDERGLEADLLILQGHAREYRRYARLLRERTDGAHRPRTVLWQRDPLTPPIIPPHIQRSLQTAAAFYDRLDWLASAGSVASARRCSPDRATVVQWSVYRALTKWRYRRAARRINRLLIDRGWPAVPYRQLRVTCECEQWIRRAVREGWLDAIFVSTLQKQDHLARLGIASTYAPIGYDPTVGENRDGRRDLDVLFLGAAPPGSSRRRRLDQLDRWLRRHGRTLRIIEQGMRGRERTDLLNRTKIMLHLHQYPWDTPWMRFVAAMACGTMMVSDRLIDSRPFVPGEHYLDTEPDRLLPTVLHSLDHEALRRRIAGQAWRFVTEQFTLKRSMDRIIEQAFDTRAYPPAASGQGE